MPTPQPIQFTEPTREELLAVTIEELREAALIMSGVSDSFNLYMRTPQRERIKPCLRRVR